MRWLLAVLLVCGVLAGLPDGGDAQVPVGDVFRKVLPSVAVIRTRGTEVSSQTGAMASFKDTGAGVLISADGRVMTAAHVVHAKDEITVEFVGGERVLARVIGSEPGADLALLQLERVPAAARVATLANSDAVEVGDPVIVVGAPHGLSYSLSVGHTAPGTRPTRSTMRSPWPSSSRRTPPSTSATPAARCSPWRGRPSASSATRSRGAAAAKGSASWSR